MKKLIPTMIAALLIGSTAVAVAGPFGPRCGGGGDGDMRMLMLDKVVDLTDEQKTALEALKDDMTPGNGAGRGQRGAMGIMLLDTAADDYQLQVEELANTAAERARERVLQKAEVHAQVQAILTEEQRAELKAFHQEVRETKKGKGQRGNWE
ncbi:Spy/CpxP family protein refolding chaperone [Teredinibacter haidensis]|uniref:Spy/CpxP family protein refolding chaperone n=1 Tax=Teredinibacter haidensis TaxID=2731755 RepID=UPI00163B7E8B|nr:Spy/CpxP family protein refolding chaperone [Teredinibacter haidensis]